MASEKKLILESITWSGRQLQINTSIDGIHFPVSIWYEFELRLLDEYYGKEFMERVYFNIAATFLLQLTCLRPKSISISSDLAKYNTIEFQEFWKKGFDNALGQWRFENDMPNWKGPFFDNPLSLEPVKPAVLKPTQVFNRDGTPVTTLAFGGGGKDGILQMKLLEEVGCPYSSYSYTLSRFGRVEEQIETAKRVLSDPVQHHSCIIIFSFMDIPMTYLKEYDVKSWTDTFLANFFPVIPVMLHYGYSNATLGNEYSANFGNLQWLAEDKVINHQWGKTLDAEKTFSDYFQKTFSKSLHYFSLLQPINDVLIYTLLQNHMDSVVLSESCNLSPPWCKKCPKCCYVWLCFQAYLPSHRIDAMFQGTNLLDMEENQEFFKELLGKGDKKPFDCVGEFEETQLAFELCYRKGLRGKAMVMYEEEVRQSVDFKAIITKFTTVHYNSHRIPKEIAEKVLVVMQKASDGLRQELSVLY